MKIFALLSILLLLLSGCDQEPDREYQEPTYSGMVYLTTNSNHLVVLNLQDQQVSRIVTDKTITAIHLLDKKQRLLLFSADGWLQSVDLNSGASGAWRQLAGRIDAVCGNDTSVYVLNRQQNEVFRLNSQTLVVDKRIKVDQNISSLQLSNDGNILWLLAKETGVIVKFDLQTMSPLKSISGAGNTIHQLIERPALKEIWVAEGNEFKNGEPYGVGFSKGRAWPGGLNILDEHHKLKDFIYIGGNVMDLEVSHADNYTLLAVSQMPIHEEASLVVMDNKNMRVIKEYRLCQTCHLARSVDFFDDRATIGAMQVRWQGRGFSKATTAGGAK